MEYPVLVERRNGLWRAFIPALGDLAAEGASRDEAVRNARRAAEEYLSKFEITTIEVDPTQNSTSRPDSPLSLLRALEAFADDGEALREHFDQIAAERQSQREEARQGDVE